MTEQLNDELLKVIQDATLIVDQTMTDIGLRPYEVCYRKVTRTGDDPLLGINGTETYVDTSFSPNPLVKRANLARSQKYPLGYVLDGDIEITFNAGQVTEEFLMNEIDYLTFQGLVFKVVKVNDLPNNSMPLKRVVLARLHDKVQ